MKQFAFKKRFFVVLALSFYCSVSSAAPNWYVGQVSRVALGAPDGSFIVTLKSSALDNCQHKYAYFNVSQIGAEQTKAAYTMALTSLSTGLDMGIVIDKALNGMDGQCDAMGMTADLRAK